MRALQLSVNQLSYLSSCDLRIATAGSRGRRSAWDRSGAEFQRESDCNLEPTAELLPVDEELLSEAS